MAGCKGNISQKSTAKKASKESKPTTFKTSLAPVLDLLHYFLFLCNLYMVFLSRRPSLLSSSEHVAVLTLLRAGHTVTLPALKPSQPECLQYLARNVSWQKNCLRLTLIILMQSQKKFPFIKICNYGVLKHGEKKILSCFR